MLTSQSILNNFLETISESDSEILDSILNRKIHESITEFKERELLKSKNTALFNKLSKYSDYDINMLIAKIMYHHDVIVNRQLDNLSSDITLRFFESHEPENRNFIYDIGFTSTVLLNSLFEIEVNKSNFSSVYVKKVPITKPNDFQRFLCITFIIHNMQKGE